MQRIILLIFALVLIGSPARAASYPSINLSTGKLFWEWTSTNGDPVTGFLITCTDVGPEGLSPQIKDVTDPTARSILLGLIPVIGGTWSCVIQAYNDTELSTATTPIVFKAFYCRPR